MRKRAQLFKSGGFRPADEFVDHSLADTATSRVACHHHRAHFRDSGAEGSQLRARQHFIVLDRHHESMNVDENVSELAQ